MFEFLGLIALFAITVGAMAFGTWRAVPAKAARIRAKTENLRRLTDNDPRLFEAMAIKDASYGGLIWGAGFLFVLGLFLWLIVGQKFFDAFGFLMLFILPASFGFLALSKLWVSMNYGDVLAEEQRREKGTRGRYGNDVHKMHNVDNIKNQVLEKLSKTGGKGPLVLLNQMDSEASKDAELERRKADPWGLAGWRASHEDRLFVIGTPGSGKTTFLIAQLIDWMQSGRSFVVTDIKPEIWSILQENGIFERYGYNDWVINPTCAHAHKFNLFAEVKNDADLNETLSVIIPNGEGDSAVFSDNARRLLKAVLSHLGEKASLPAARDFIMEAGKVSDLLEILRESDKKSVQRIAFELTNTASNDRLMASIMTAMSRAFEFMDDARIEEAISSSDFVMRDVLMQPKQAVFLQFEQEFKSSLATLFGGTVAYVLRVLQTTSPQREDAVFVALDEIMNAAPIPRFTESLNTMRSAKMPLGMYLQSTEGLDRVYGPGASELFMGSADLRVVFRVGDNKTAEYVSAQLGDTEQRNYSVNSSNSQGDGASGSKETVSYSSSTSVGYSSSTARIFEASEVLGLEPGKAIVLYRGTGARFSMPRYDTDYPASLKASRTPYPLEGFNVAEAIEASA